MWSGLGKQISGLNFRGVGVGVGESRAGDEGVTPYPGEVRANPNPKTDDLKIFVI